jgi:hypothetical protein
LIGSVSNWWVSNSIFLVCNSGQYLIWYEALTFGLLYPTTPIMHQMKPHLQWWREIRHKYTQRWHGPDANQRDNSHCHMYGTCRVQVFRSVCDWSHGVLTKHSIQDACAYFKWYMRDWANNFSLYVL